MADTGWQISTLRDPYIIQLVIYGPFSEQTIISALSETLAQAQSQSIGKVLIDKSKTTVSLPNHADDPLSRLAFKLFSGQATKTALVLADRYRNDESLIALLQEQSPSSGIHCFFDRESALRWLTQ